MNEAAILQSKARRGKGKRAYARSASPLFIPPLSCALLRSRMFAHVGRAVFLYMGSSFYDYLHPKYVLLHTTSLHSNFQIPFLWKEIFQPKVLFPKPSSSLATWTEITSEDASDWLFGHWSTSSSSELRSAISIFGAVKVKSHPLC